MSKGKFIVLEGGEGVGKSSNLQLIQDNLASRNIPFVCTREPGGTVLGEAVREILLKSYAEPVSVDAELLLMFAARAEHLEKVIQPALARGEWVLCDRFTDASYAYQGGGRQIPTQRIAALETWAQGDLRPDLVILLDAPVEIGLERIKTRHALDRFEQEQKDFFLRVREAYLSRAKEAPSRYQIIDASLPLQDVQAEISQRLSDFIINN